MNEPQKKQWLVRLYDPVVARVGREISRRVAIANT